MLSAVLIHSFGSLVARQFAFSSIYFAAVTLLIYATVAGLVARGRTWSLGVLAAIATAGADMTIGTAVWWLVDPAGRPAAGLTTTFVTYSAIGAGVMGFFGGLVGASIGTRFRAHEPTPS